MHSSGWCMRSHNKSHHQWRKEIKTKRVFNFTKRTADLFVEKGRGGGILHSNIKQGGSVCRGRHRLVPVGGWNPHSKSVNGAEYPKLSRHYSSPRKRTNTSPEGPQHRSRLNHDMRDFSWLTVTKKMCKGGSPAHVSPHHTCFGTGSYTPSQKAAIHT